MTMDAIVEWLHEGDVSIQYLTRKYLLGEKEEALIRLRKRITTEGWGKSFLDARNSTGHWGKDFYQLRWTCSHYTLLDLRYLEIESVEPIMDTLGLILSHCKSPDGSISESQTIRSGDICVNGMFLNYASFFRVPEDDLKSVIDYLLDNVMPDGGFNCRKKASHSSMHTTISVLEGFCEYIKAGYQYRAYELEKVKKNAEEFLLVHRLYKSDKTGEIIDKRWMMLSFPSRWRYDILRALLYFVDAGSTYDSRMDEAIELLISKKRKNGIWPVQAKHPGLVHFDMEKTGSPSRFNTLRALRVLKKFG
ncbi:hypothetical protein JR334_07265 [Clostridia bacterium]|nr:hypothetical protein JR334_07265 [Clostridia bacterium]